LRQLDAADAGLATQLGLLVDGSIAQDLVRDDPSMARAAKEAARVMLRNAGIEIDDHDPRAQHVAKKRASSSKRARLDD